MKKNLATIFIISLMSFEAQAWLYLRTNDGAYIMWKFMVFHTVVNKTVSDLLSECNATQLDTAPYGGDWHQYWEGNFVGDWSTLSSLVGPNLPEPSSAFMECSAQIANQMVHQGGWRILSAPLAAVGGALLIAVGVGAFGLGYYLYKSVKDGSNYNEDPIVQSDKQPPDDEIGLESVGT